jgi:hypothetical protein
MNKTPRGRQLVVALALVAAAIATSPRALGQTEQATKEAAESEFKEGLRRLDAGDEEGARRSFLSAYSVLRDPSILYNLASTERLTGHPVEALQHYKLFVADRTAAGGDRETALERIMELTALVGHVAIDAPAGAELWVDEQMLPSKAPLSEPADVAAGTHTVRARFGDQTRTVSVSCAPGQTVQAKIDIPLTEASPLLVPTAPESIANLRETGEKPPKEERYVSSAARVTTLVVLGAGAVALLGAGIGLEVASSKASSAAAADVTQLQYGGISSSVCSDAMMAQNITACSNLASELSAHSTEASAAAGLFVSAGVLAATFAVAWVAWPKTRVGERAQILPLVSPSMAGLGLGGSF